MCSSILHFFIWSTLSGFLCHQMMDGSSISVLSVRASTLFFKALGGSWVFSLGWPAPSDRADQQESCFRSMLPPPFFLPVYLVLWVLSLAPPPPCHWFLCNSSRFLKSAAVSYICVCPVWQIPGQKPLSCCLPVLRLSVRQEGVCRQHENVMQLDVMVLKQGLKNVEELRGFHFRTKVNSGRWIHPQLALKNCFLTRSGSWSRWF